MPRSRGSAEMPQKLSPRASMPLKTMTACSDANGGGAAHRTSPRKLEDRRSPRSPVQEKKKVSGGRAAELESKLSEAQEQLKQLREQLAVAEAANAEVQLELHEAKKQIQSPLRHEEDQTEHITESLPPPPQSPNVSDVCSSNGDETAPAEKDLKAAAAIVEEEEAGAEEPPPAEESEVAKLGSLLAEREKELEIMAAENDRLKKQVAEVAGDVAVAQAKEEELGEKLVSMGEELSEIRERTEKLNDQLVASEAAKEGMEVEMRKLRVQTEQWRKAAEAAAAVLASDVDDGGGVMSAAGPAMGIGRRRAAERCGSMDKHFGGGFVAGIDSPVMDDGSGFGGGAAKKKSGGGMRVFGELWKKKQHQNLK